MPGLSPDPDYDPHLAAIAQVLRRLEVLERRDAPPVPAKAENGGIWKVVAIALLSFVLSGAVAFFTFTRGIVTTEQIREERATSKEERGSAQRDTDALWKGVKDLDDKVGAITREQDRRGGRLERAEEGWRNHDGRVGALESAQGSLAALRVELRVLQEAQSRMETMVRELHDRMPRRPEPAELPRGKLPRGFP